MLEAYRPRKLIVYSRDEWKQHDMRMGGFDHPSMRYFIGDVRDQDRLRRAMQDVDIVVHAAALKQVPTCEYNPIEAVATNISGARNVIDAALDSPVRHVLALSTDKATAPLNLYGATKLVSEKLFVHANHYNLDPVTRFSCVRYGNVLGSRGSVVPLFAEQKINGTIRVTDARMTRFWMTLEQGVRFVIACIERMQGGEVFMPKLPSMKVVDLARVVAPEAEIQFTSIRPGEKLHESLISAEESRSVVDVGDGYVMVPADQPWVVESWEQQGERVPEGFAYASDTNDRWLTSDEMMELIDATADVCHA
jgi:UDP-N-acetylglucosamine 4,6-dehydratase